jgi:hypothetical protein
VQYSDDGSTWGSTPGAGTVYARFSTDGGGTWGDAVQIRGEDATTGGYAILQDRKPSGTQGGTATNGAWRERVLNHKPVDTGDKAKICQTLGYDNQTVAFQVGEVVTDGTSGATGLVVLVEASVLTLADVDGTFGDNNALTGDLGGVAQVDGAQAESGRFWLADGTHHFNSSSPFLSVYAASTRLHNLTTGAVSVDGTPAYSSAASAYGLSRSEMCDVLVIDNAGLGNVFVVEYRVESTRATYGLGNGVGAVFAVGSEIYTCVYITTESA